MILTVMTATSRMLVWLVDVTPVVYFYSCRRLTLTSVTSAPHSSCFTKELKLDPTAAPGALAPASLSLHSPNSVNQLNVKSLLKKRAGELKGRSGGWEDGVELMMSQDTKHSNWTGSGEDFLKG